MKSKIHFDEYVMVAPGSDYGMAMWDDLKSLPNCTFYDYVLGSRSKLLSLIHHIHFSFSLNKNRTLPFQGFWNSAFSLQPDKLDPNKNYCAIFTDISACRVGCQYLRSLYDMPNVTLILVLVNIASSKAHLLKERYEFFSLKFSFDKADCEKYGFIYHPTFYSKTRDPKHAELKSDVFFVGVSKGKRHEKLLKLHQRMKEVGLKADFYITHVNKNEHREEGIHYNEWLNYNSVLDKVMKSRCIVEIMGNNQDGLTLRAMEAICYNKLLITDNPSVRNLPFYKTGFIHYSEIIEDTDLSFLLSQDLVDYHYKNEFSPKHLIHHIENILS